MSTAFARIEQRLGASALARLSNAPAILPLGGRVDGIFARLPAQAPVGSGVSTRTLSFTGATVDFVEPVVRGLSVYIVHGGVTTNWLVVDVTALPDLGQTELTLEAS